MVKLTRSRKIVGHSSNCKRWGMLSALVVFLGSIHIQSLSDLLIVAL